MGKNNKSLKLNTAEFLITIFLIVYLLAKVISISSIVSNGMIAATGLLCLGYTIIYGRYNIKWYMIALIASALMCMSIISNSNASLLNLAWIWCYLGVALLLFCFNIRSEVLMLNFIIVAAYLVLQVILGVDAQDILARSSGNGISTLILFYLILLYIKRYEEGKTILYWPSIVAVALSVSGNGRGGVLASVVFLVAIFLYDFIIVNKLKISTLLKIVLLVSIGTIIINYIFGDYIIYLINKVNRYGFTSIRTEIWMEYLNGITSSMEYFVFGVPTTDLQFPLLANVSGNTHNIFLMAHSKFGILGFSYIIIATIISVLTYLKCKEYFYIIIILTWFVRSMFDWTGFPGVYDIIFWYFVICGSSIKQRYKQYQICRERMDCKNEYVHS